MKDVENGLRIKNIGKIIENFPFILMLTRDNIRRQISNCRDNSFYLVCYKCFCINGFISAVLIYVNKSLTIPHP
jgi:hypothetical protein